MDRKEFVEKTVKLGLCSCGLLMLSQSGIPLEAAEKGTDELAEVKAERDFLVNWMSDLRDSMEKHLDTETKEKLFDDCGVQCFKRHKFKTDIAKRGEGNIEKLMEAYKENFIVYLEGNQFHIKYGNEGLFCYCPVGKNMKSIKNDVHCECTRATHQAIFETAMKRKFKVELVETFKRDNKPCHLIVHLNS